MSEHAQSAQLQEIAHRLADIARVETLKLFRSPGLSTDNKDQAGGFDPVTAADRRTEEEMRKVLSEHRPQDGVIGEEFGVVPGESDFTWVLDPIDGTRAFISGTASWGVLISVERDGYPIFGMIDQPYLQERFVGGCGNADLLTKSGKRRLSTRRCNSLKDATLLTTFPEIGTLAERARFERVRDNVRLTRYGLDCYGYALLALGQVDMVIEAGLSHYDISAPIAVVEAAGGIVTNWQGDPVKEGGQVVAAGDRRVHTQALELLNA